MKKIASIYLVCISPAIFTDLHVVKIISYCRTSTSYEPTLNF